MTRGTRILKDMMKFINDARKDFPEVTDDMLEFDGKMVYFNYNMSSEKEYFERYRTCPFIVYYKETGKPFMFLFFSAQDYMTLYTSVTRHGRVFRDERSLKMEDGDTYFTSMLMKLEADDKNLINETIDKINFDRDSVGDKDYFSEYWGIDGEEEDEDDER